MPRYLNLCIDTCEGLQLLIYRCTIPLAVEASVPQFSSQGSRTWLENY